MKEKKPGENSNKKNSLKGVQKAKYIYFTFPIVTLLFTPILKVHFQTHKTKTLTQTHEQIRWQKAFLLP